MSVLRRFDLWLGGLIFGTIRKGMQSSIGMHDTLWAKHFDKNGKLIEKRCLGHNLVVDDGMEFFVDAWQNSVELETCKYHDTGIGTTGEASGDSAMETPTGFDRGTGDLGEGDNAKEFKSIGTVTCTATKAVTEWGLFSAITNGILIARKVFAAINVVDGDYIEFTWENQLSAS